MKLAARDGVVVGRRAECIIMIFEVLMIAYTIISGTWTTHVRLYFAGYIFLLVASMILFLVILYIKRDIDKRYQIVRPANYVYDLLLMAWAVYMTVIENYYNASFSALVFITILVIIPVVSFLEPLEYLVLHLCGCVSILIVIQRLTVEEKFGNTINFIVFALISFVAGISFYGIRLKSYKREVQLAQMAERDGLSQLYNRQKLGQVSKSIWESCVEKQNPLTCVLCDIDDFKMVNDQYGHLMGDYWIRNVADIIKAVKAGEEDMCFRYGGEEFMIVLPGKTAEESCEMVRAIQGKLREVCDARGDGLFITLSYGIYSGHPQALGGDIERYFSKADSLLYEAKRKGKDCYCVEEGSLS